MKKKKVAQSNVFSDLGFDKPESENLRIRAELMMQVKQFIEANQLTQKEAASLLDVDQPRISKLLSGRIDLFTIDLLIQMLAKVGIKMVLKKAA